jgi:hypothetical protein
LALNKLQKACTSNPKQKIHNPLLEKYNLIEDDGTIKEEVCVFMHEVATAFHKIEEEEFRPHNKIDKKAKKIFLLLKDMIIETQSEERIFELASAFSEFNNACESQNKKSNNALLHHYKIVEKDGTIPEEVCSAGYNDILRRKILYYKSDCVILAPGYFLMLSNYYEG